MRFDVKIDDELWKLFRKDDVFNSDAEALESILVVILAQIDRRNPGEMLGLLKSTHKVRVRTR